jgi:hypothetical protein
MAATAIQFDRGNGRKKGLIQVVVIDHNIGLLSGAAGLQVMLLSRDIAQMIALQSGLRAAKQGSVSLHGAPQGGFKGYVDKYRKIPGGSQFGPQEKDSIEQQDVCRIGGACRCMQGLVVIDIKDGCMIGAVSARPQRVKQGGVQACIIEGVCEVPVG